MMWWIIRSLENPMDKLFTMFPVLIYPWSIMSFVVVPVILMTFNEWWWLAACYSIGAIVPGSYITLSALLAWKRGKLIDERKVE